MIEKPLVVRVWCGLVSNVDRTGPLLSRLHEWNTDTVLARLILVKDVVLAGVDIPAAPFSPEHLRQACQALREVASHFGPLLQKELSTAGVTGS